MDELYIISTLQQRFSVLYQDGCTDKELKSEVSIDGLQLWLWIVICKHHKAKTYKYITFRLLRWNYPLFCQFEFCISPVLYFRASLSWYLAWSTCWEISSRWSQLRISNKRSASLCSNSLWNPSSSHLKEVAANTQTSIKMCMWNKNAWKHIQIQGILIAVTKIYLWQKVKLSMLSVTKCA